MTKDEFLKTHTTIIVDSNGNILSLKQGSSAKHMTLSQARDYTQQQLAQRQVKTSHVIGILLICTYFIWMMVL